MAVGPCVGSRPDELTVPTAGLFGCVGGDPAQRLDALSVSPLPPVPQLPPLPSTVPAGKLPHWQTDPLVHRACPVCGSERAEPFCRRPDGLVVSRCGGCGMIYLADLPTAESIRAFYVDYAKYKGITPSRRRSRLLSKLGLVPASPYLEPYLGILETTGGLQGQSLCEIGCSVGDFLIEAREAGATVSGVEWDDQAIAVLSAQGIPASHELPQGAKLDVVCAFQLLEHLSDPSEFAANVSAALKPDGRLLLALPNGGEGDEVGPCWVGFRVDLEHLNYFSVASLTRLLAQQGLWVERFWTYLPPQLPRGGTRPGFASEVGRKLRSLTSRFSAQPQWADGSYVLCVLARKCP